MQTTRLPDSRGYFGEYGGRFVPETLMPALEELAEGYEDEMGEGAFIRELNALTRRPCSYRGPQDKQRAWTGATRTETRQAAHCRRDRSRPARGRNRRRLREAGTGLRGVHGR